MQIICKPRGGGKTTDLINRAAKTGGIIICSSGEEKDRIINQARHMGCSILAPLTYHEAVDQFRHRECPGRPELLIDRIEAFLAYCLKGINPIGAITATYTEADPYRPPKKESDLWHIHGTPEKSDSVDEACLQFIYMDNGNRFNGVGNFDGVYFKDIANNGELIDADNVLCWRSLTWPK